METNIDYKEKYEEALKIAKKLLKNMEEGEYFASITDIKIIFPELQESESERIRKEIIDFIKRRDRSGCDYDYDKWITWLEKQGEQKREWSEDDEEMLKSIIATCELAEQDRDSSPARHLFEMQDKWLKSLKDRYTWNPSDEQLDALHDAAVYVDKSMFPYPKGTLMKLYKQLKKIKG